jgi:hypothetical protein
LAALARSPFAAEELSDPDGLVVLTKPDGADLDLRVADVLSSLPCIVIAIERPPGQAPHLADLSVEDGIATVDEIVRAVERNPIAATSLVLCLREGWSTPGRGLVAESAAYSVLQSGAEFTRWRAAHSIRGEGSEAGPAVRIERSGNRLDLLLNRPHVRNALSSEMRDGLLEGLTVAASDPSITEIVLRGEGESFCSGGDLDEFGSFADPASAHIVRLVASIGRAISAIGPRLVVQVHGPCAGSGVELPAFATRVDAHSTFMARLPEVSMGLIPGAGGTVSITGRIGRHRMALLALSGATIDAGTALEWGLVDRVIDG